MILFNKSLNIELINAVCVGLEIADSRAVWVVDKVTGSASVAFLTSKQINYIGLSNLLIETL